MKARQFLILMILTVSTLSLQNASAQNYTQWHLPEGAKARIGKGWISGNIAFSPDSNVLAVPTSIGIWIYDVYKREELDLLTGHTDIVLSVAFSPDGNLLASGGEDNTVRVWDIATGINKMTLIGHTSRVNSVAFSPDSLTLASAGSDGRTCLWDLTTGYRRATFIGDIGEPVSNVAFSPDGKTLASTGSHNDYNVRLWDVTNNRHRATFHERSSSIEFSPDGQTFASGWADITLRDVNSGEIKATFSGHTDRIGMLAFSPNGRTLLSGSRDGTVRLWDVETATQKTILTEQISGITNVVFSPDGSTLASAIDESTILLSELPSAPSTVVLETTDFEAEKAAIQEVYSRFYKAFNERDFEKVAETMDTSRAAMFGTVFSDSEPIPVVIGWNSVRVLIEGLWRGIGTKGAKWGPNDKLADFWIRQTEASARGYNCYKGPYPGETYLYLVKKNGEWRIQQIESITQDNLPIFKDNPRIRNYFTDPENKTQNMDEPAISQRREDLNSDGVVNIQDLVIVSANFGKRGQTVADVNGDDIVDIRDLVLVAGAINHEQ